MTHVATATKMNGYLLVELIVAMVVISCFVPMMGAVFVQVVRYTQSMQRMFSERFEWQYLYTIIHTDMLQFNTGGHAQVNAYCFDTRDDQPICYRLSGHVLKRCKGGRCAPLTQQLPMDSFQVQRVTDRLMVWECSSHGKTTQWQFLLSTI